MGATKGATYGMPRERTTTGRQSVVGVSRVNPKDGMCQVNPTQICIDGKQHRSSIKSERGRGPGGGEEEHTYLHRVEG